MKSAFKTGQERASGYLLATSIPFCWFYQVWSKYVFELLARYVLGCIVRYASQPTLHSFTNTSPLESITFHQHSLTPANMDRRPCELCHAPHSVQFTQSQQSHTAMHLTGTRRPRQLWSYRRRVEVHHRGSLWWTQRHRKPWWHGTIRSRRNKRWARHDTVG